MRPLEPIRVKLSTDIAWCGCCRSHKLTIFRGDKKISFFVCGDFATWFRQRYAHRQPRLAKIWRDLDSYAWMRYALYFFDNEGEAYALWFAVTLTATTNPDQLLAENVRRCLSPDLIEALVAEKLDTM